VLSVNFKLKISGFFSFMRIRLMIFHKPNAEKNKVPIKLKFFELSCGEEKRLITPVKADFF